MTHQFMGSYIVDSIAIFSQYKQIAEKAFSQLSETQLAELLDVESSSVAQIVKMLSRWTGFLTTDVRSQPVTATLNSWNRPNHGKRC